jgi:hypothetical protein
MTPAIIRTEHRRTITFSEKPTAEQCRELRAAGYDYDRRNGVWFIHDVVTAAHDAPALITSLAA